MAGVRSDSRGLPTNWFVRRSFWGRAANWYGVYVWGTFKAILVCGKRARDGRSDIEAIEREDRMESVRGNDAINFRDLGALRVLNRPSSYLSQVYNIHKSHP